MNGGAGGHDPGQGLREAAARKGSFVQSMKAVAWSFFGIRKSSEYEKDVSQLNASHCMPWGGPPSWIETPVGAPHLGRMDRWNARPVERVDKPA